jgi:hypothetical protein
LHDFNGGVAPSGLFWTVRLDDGAVVPSRNGRRLEIDARDVAVLDDTPTGRMSAVVSFEMRWKAAGGRRRLGRPRTALPPDPAAFSGRLFVGAHARGVFSGASGGFTFQSDPARPARSTFAELGNERNGLFLPAASRCRTCAGHAAMGSTETGR